MKLAFHVRPLRGPLSATALAALALGPASASGGVFDDAKFKLDLRGGDPNGNAFVDSGEVVNAINPAQTAVLGGGQGPSKITAAKYASGGYDSYGKLPYVTDISVVNPADGSTYTQKGLVLPQSSKTVDTKTQWSENGIVFTQGAVQPGEDGYVTLYARFKRDAHTGGAKDPNLLLGNGWDGTYGNTDNGISIYIYGDNCIGIVGGGGMPKSSVKVEANTWYDLFVKVRNEGDSELAVAYITLYKANADAAPTVTTGTINHNKKMQYSASKTRVPIGCYLTPDTGWAQKTNPRAFKGQIADAMIWNRALTEAEMAEVVAGPPALGGEWQIGAVNGSADEFDDADPAAVYDVQSMPWRRMRKTLDSTNPSLSISTTMTADDAKRNRTLTLTPILSGASSAPVEVALNGTVVGSIDLASETSITLPRRLWLHGSGLANTITVTRTAPLSGTVQLDAVSLAPGEYGDAGSVLDDTVFQLDLRGGESTFTQPGDLGNVLDFSSASPLVGYMGDQRGPQTYTTSYLRMPAQEAADVPNPYYPYTTNSQTVLHFYQDQQSENKAENTGVVIPGAAPQGAVQTFYLRLRWDGETQGGTRSPSYIFQSGNATNGWSAYGLALYLKQDSVSEDLATTNAVFGFRAADSQADFANLVLEAGEWADVFFTMRQNADNTGYTATASLCKPNPNTSAAQFYPPSMRTQSRTGAKPIVFNSRNLMIGGYHNSDPAASLNRSFRGLIADFRIWERALTDREKIEVMAGQHGATWTIGAKNGSADEFTDDDPAAVFEPLAMPWKRMRKTLTAANPTLTLKAPIAEHDAGKPMILHVDPILSGTAAEVPVAVAVNGVAAGTLDLAKQHGLVIERQYWTRDADGNVTVALTRAETSGTISIDAITLSGSWQITPANRATDGMLDQLYASGVAFAGDTAVKHFPCSISVGASHTNYTFCVWVPEGMGETCGWKFRTATTGNVNAPTGLEEQHTLYVNGTAVGTHEGKFGTFESFTLDIPAGTLRDGMNTVQWVQTMPTHDDQQALDGKSGIFQFYDFWGMTLVPPASPFMLIVR